MGMYNKRTLSAINVTMESRETYIFHIKAQLFNGCLKVLMFLCFCKILVWSLFDGVVLMIFVLGAEIVQ